MKSTLVTSIVVFVVWLHCGAGFFAAPPETVNSENEPSAVRSESVSLGDGDYRLVARNRSELLLEHEIGGKVSRWPIEIQKEQPATGQSDESWGNDEVREIALSRLSRAALVAVVNVKSRDKDEATFWCLTILNVKEVSAKRAVLTARAGVIAKGSKEDRILALSGNRFLNSITAVMGRWSESQPGAFESGTIFFQGCPSFGSMGGRTGKFKTEYAASPFDAVGKGQEGK